ncbi:hypothetical protein AVEN_42665-1 [Araneus ventricosus]|uniref:Uncharacterized protein n=1 Tax=Araneus ventricosus TaxID=182803 RepID=A0A4Y2BMC5_ARAVE|nr:hypothetical protein AVEN_42665-1 [Araneus ventricosus]
MEFHDDYNLSLGPDGLRSRLRRRRVPSVNPDFTEDPSCMWACCTLNLMSWANRCPAGVVRKLGEVKQRSFGLSFHEFRPRFALFPIVRTGRIDVARRLVSASVVSRVMAANSSHVKGGGVARRHQCVSSLWTLNPMGESVGCGRQCIHSLEGCREISQATRRRNGATVRNSTIHMYELRGLPSHTPWEQGLSC